MADRKGYKLLRANGTAIYGRGSWHLPITLLSHETLSEITVPGEWMPEVPDISLCRQGYHYTDTLGDVLLWACWPDLTLYEVEVHPEAQVITGRDKSVCSQARLVRPIWFDQYAIAVHCLQAVREIVTKHSNRRSTFFRGISRFIQTVTEEVTRESGRAMAPTLRGGGRIIKSLDRLENAIGAFQEPDMRAFVDFAKYVIGFLDNPEWSSTDGLWGVIFQTGVISTPDRDIKKEIVKMIRDRSRNITEGL